MSASTMRTRVSYYAAGLFTALVVVYSLNISVCSVVANAPMETGLPGPRPSQLVAAHGQVSGSPSQFVDDDAQEDALNPRRPQEDTLTSRRLESLEYLYSAGSKTAGLLCAHGYICVGADRMRSASHTYGPCYAAMINKMMPLWLHGQPSSKLVVGEVGILTGSGLAVWSSVFPEAEVHGFDFFLNNTRDNLPFLRSKGAFARGDPVLHTYDQTKKVAVNAAETEELFRHGKLQLLVDDGLHTDRAIIDTFLSFKDSMHERGLYVIEDVAPPAGIKSCSSSKRAAKACRDRARKQFAEAFQEHGWEMHDCTEDARWFGLTRQNGLVR